MVAKCQARPRLRSSPRPRQAGENMSDGFWVAVIIIAAVAVYTVGKVLSSSRKSERQWREVDKSKLKTWDDDDD